MSFKSLFRITLFSLFLCGNVFAANTILFGTVKEGSQDEKILGYTNTINYNESRERFPLKQYSVYMNAYDLKYPKNLSPEDQLKNIDNLNDFTLSIGGHLDLLSFDEKTGIYKFKLTLKILGLDYTGTTNKLLLLKGGVPLKGNIKLVNEPSNYPPTFNIEGRFAMVNGKATLISSNSNKYFDLEFREFGTSKAISVRLLHDFPIAVEST